MEHQRLADVGRDVFEVGLVLLGEDDSLGAGSRERASALCWIAYSQLLNGRVEHALDTFRQASSLGAPGSLESVLADAELRRFGSSQENAD